MKTEAQYNIMTSSDDNLVPYVAVQLTAIAQNLKTATVDFYLFHSRVSRKNIEMLTALCGELNGGSIKFHEVLVPDAEIYTELAKLGNGWNGEAYYSLCAHLLLPAEVDRVMYLDAGDTLVLDDIGPYYNCDFQGKSLMVTGARYKIVNEELRMLDEQDLGDKTGGLPGVLRGIFNSGSYVMNLEKMRKDGLTLADYQYLAEKLHEAVGKEPVYWGDQGLLSAAFVGDVCYYGYPEIRNAYYMPYNFCLWFYDRYNARPDFPTAVVHFAGTAIKPWNGRYPVFLKRFQKSDQLHSLEEVKMAQVEYFYIWHEYAILTDGILERLGL
jgi:lipopolysaccharide biosynthesis glycosyltransferase